MRFFRSSVCILLVYLLIISCIRQKITTNNDSVHLLLGNPTNAQASESVPDNYLIVKPQYALSYNRSKGHANWVAWELSQKWLGTSDRQNDFRPDPILPVSWYKVTPNDYTNSGFDRGHLCPSADRTNSVDNNSSTFVMTNMIPQAPELNREAWAYLEEYCRELVAQKYRLFIVCGTYGTGGEGSKGTLKKLDNAVNVPARVYKVITILPENGTVNDINANTPVIAVDFPNKTSALQNTGWFRFITTTADIEKKTGLTFFTNTPKSTQASLQTKRFDFTSAPLNVDTKCRQYNGRQLYIGKSGGCYYINSNGNKSYVERDLCNCQ